MRPKRRIVNLHASFSPNGDTSARFSDVSAFYTFWINASNYLLRLSQQKLRKDKANFRRVVSAKEKVDPILQKMSKGTLTVEESAKAIREQVPDQGVLRELFNVYDKVIMVTPEQVEKSEKELGEENSDIDRQERVLKASQQILDGLSLLASYASEGDLNAAKSLSEAATNAAYLLQMSEKKQSLMFGQIAKETGVWPVLATDEIGWEKFAAERVNELHLGENLQWFKTRFRNARGHDDNLPARVWAKLAVRTIEETRLRFLVFGQILRDFGSTEKLASFCENDGWEFSIHPGWVAKMTKLPKLSKDSHQAWAAAIRSMIREQLPDFHTCHQWMNQRNTAKASGRDTKGIIQNRILDDICDALKSLAPSLPEEQCRNSATEIR